jgi:hypothetical protein
MLAHTQIFADQAKPSNQLFVHLRKSRLFCANLRSIKAVMICHGPTRTNSDKINFLGADPENG